MISRAPGEGIANAADLLPPSSDRLHGERRRVIVDADVHPARVGGQIINSIRHGASKLLDQKIVRAHVFGRALRTPFASGVLKSPTSSFFFVSTEITGWLAWPS